MSFNIVAGDLEPSIIFDLTVNGAPEDVRDATDSIMHWTQPDGTVSDVAVSLIFTGPNAYSVMREWDSGDTDQVGTHLALVMITRPGSRPQTFPSDGSHFTWTVEPTP